MKSRRGAGEGSVFQLPERGLWVGVIELPRGADGVRRKLKVAGKTKGAVLDKLEVARVRKSAGVGAASGTLTVAKFLDEWTTVTLPASGRVKAATIDNYISVAQHSKAAFGKVKLAKLTPAHVETMMVEMEAAGYASNTRRLARAVLRRALRTAEQRGLVLRNVAALADGPRNDGARVGRTLTPAEAEKLICAASGHQLEVLIVVGLSLGLRPGESLALRWADIDIPGKSLTVSGTLRRSKGHGLVRTSPKSSKSRRVLPLSKTAIDALTAQRRQQAKWRLAAGPAWEDTGYVITTDTGGPVDPANVARMFTALTKKTLGEKWRPHELRHSAASLLLAQGVPLRFISDVLGHSSIRVTSDVYGHLAPAALREHVEVLERVLTGGAK